MPSRRFDRSLARESRLDAVKKLSGLSRAVFTFLPVDRRFCVVASRSAVFWAESRLCRVAAERTIPDMMASF